MSPWFEAILAKYGPPLAASLLGVSIGTAAKYGLTMGEGRKVKRAEVISDCLLVPFMCLLSGVIGIQMEFDPLWSTTFAAFIAISSDRVVRMLRERFIQRIAAEVALIDQHKGEQRQLAAIEQSATHIATDGLNAPTAGAKLVRELPPTPPSNE